MELIKANQNTKAFQNMFNLYAHELSQYNPWLETQIDEEGNYLTEAVHDYIFSGDFESYVMKEGKTPIGMVVFSSCEEDGQWFHDVEEIFIINTSRRKGIIERICSDFWNRRKGTGTLHVLAGNQHALQYWDKVLERTGHEYQKEEDNGMVVYHFTL